jgi:hypothetical protein
LGLPCSALVKSLSMWPLECACCMCGSFVSMPVVLGCWNVLSTCCGPFVNIPAVLGQCKVPLLEGGPHPRVVSWAAH